MATVKNNIVTQGLSGKLGNQIVFRSGKGGQTIVAVKPAPGREFNAAQQAHHEAFRNAIAYAKTAKDEAVYVVKAQGSAMSAFNAAVADWFNEPKVLEIEANDWNGESGRVIRIKAQDDTFVDQVSVVISEEGGVVYEQGNAERADGLWWEYTTTQDITTEAALVITATVKDLPGNSGQLNWQNN